MSNSNASSPSGGKANEQSQAADAHQKRLESALSRIRNKFLVMSGKGGVGKSSVATNIAVALAEKGFRTGLLDVDLHGPSIARMTGMEGLLDITEDRSTIIPKSLDNGLKVVSMQSLMQDPDQAVIWRGPAKTGIIQQFIANVKWDALDFLIVDAPPGTGDEPLTVAQTINDAKAVVVTTPQDVALNDVRKSINFCRTVDLEILGIVENMGPFTCPCCDKPIALFKENGGKATAEQMGLLFLGTLPFDPNVVKACDTGLPMMAEQKDSEFSKALDGVVEKMVSAL